jgi:hypothetical protein
MKLNDIKKELGVEETGNLQKDLKMTEIMLLKAILDELKKQKV